MFTKYFKLIAGVISSIKQKIIVAANASVAFVKSIFQKCIEVKSKRSKNLLKMTALITLLYIFGFAVNSFPAFTVLIGIITALLTLVIAAA